MRPWRGGAIRQIGIIGLLAAGCASIPAAVHPAKLPPAEGGIDRGDLFYAIPRTPDHVRQAALSYEGAAQRRDQTYRGAWMAARAYAWLAQYAREDRAQQERDLASAVDLSRRAVAAAPDQVEGHYYLAVSLGLFSQAHSAINHLTEMAREGEIAASINPRVDHAGPYRLLGSLYGFAPEPPISFGDQDKGLELLRQAVKLVPDEPENHLRLAQLLAAMGKREEARNEVQTALFLDSSGNDPTETLAWQLDAKTLWQKIK
ncbi:MAG TPA: tetratricopeptide repeat protein [Nitrospiria bacterium]|nr:tetratricopeptide repeat protein [Nitrospiria bacterium]